ncbi:hypothetical protein AB0I98_49855 [Streptomyces sp. NPDC050211]|uniref:hypothetical protein n=1 Tax=Streptomyces sp. NPDC050211 TaxID=3154932 RepID=UPI00342C93A8
MTEQADGGRRRHLRIAAAVTVAVLAAAGGFLAGRTTAPTSGGDGSACTSAKAAMDQAVKESADTPADAEQGVKDARAAMMVNVVLQNPDCFSVAMRAQAQTAKDELTQRGAADAAARAGQCANPDSWWMSGC